MRLERKRNAIHHFWEITIDRRKVTMRNAEFTDALCERLSASKILPQKRVLE